MPDEHNDYKRRRAERLAVDPGRPLPREYDEERVSALVDSDRDKLLMAYRKVSKIGPPAEVLADLSVPVLVLRDILAAASQWGSEALGGTVAFTFRRAVRLVASLSSDGLSADYQVPQPWEVLGEDDVAFVHAVREQLAASGDEIILPPVPPLPEWVSKEDQAMATFGWLRLAVADTSGLKLHAPGCHTTRHAPRLATTDHMPWWRVMLEDPSQLCGVCGGPGVRDLLPVAEFVAALDAWHDRGRGRIERWQQGAFQRLLVASAAARAQAQEPDITLGHRIVEVLAENAPGREGWDAYCAVVLANWGEAGKYFKGLTAKQQKAARALACERMSVLEAALPSSQRPQPLPADADREAIQQRYKHLRGMLADTVPQLHRLLFTLPNAVEED